MAECKPPEPEKVHIVMRVLPVPPAEFVADEPEEQDGGTGQDGNVEEEFGGDRAKQGLAQGRSGIGGRAKAAQDEDDAGQTRRWDDYRPQT